MQEFEAQIMLLELDSILSGKNKATVPGIRSRLIPSFHQPDSIVSFSKSSQICLYPFQMLLELLLQGYLAT